MKDVHAAIGPVANEAGISADEGGHGKRRSLDQRLPCHCGIAPLWLQVLGHRVPGDGRCRDDRHPAVHRVRQSDPGKACVCPPCFGRGSEQCSRVVHVV